MTNSHRIETDAIGEVRIPSDALWGSASQRALENFPVSTRRFPKNFIGAISMIKRFAADANCDLKLIGKEIASAISEMAMEVESGRHEGQFPLDIFQTGSGTSTNMNVNEVIANLANVRLGGEIGKYRPVHPNDHVNLGQSSNDIMPSALHVAAACRIKDGLLPSLEDLGRSLEKKADQFDHILKIGRTHLMDAMPIRLGQEFGGWAREVVRAAEWIENTLPCLHELAIGGTAVGTGIGAHPDFAAKVCRRLSKQTGIDFRPAKNHFEAVASRAPLAMIGGALRTAACVLGRIADDIRLLASGPRLGFAELILPALQPGSSIMPGKVNPVMPEMLSQISAQVIANDHAIADGVRAGHLELNTQLPLIASNLLESIDILASGSKLFAARCVDGIEADEEICSTNAHMSLALATALVPKIGYAEASEIAKKAHASGRSIRDVSTAEGIAADDELDRILDIKKLTGK